MKYLWLFTEPTIAYELVGQNRPHINDHQLGLLRKHFASNFTNNRLSLSFSFLFGISLDAPKSETEKDRERDG